MLLKEIKLRANDLPGLQHFYKDVLELPTTHGNGTITIIAGKSLLIFEEAAPETNPFYHFAFNIPSNKFDEALEWMKQKVELLWLEDYNGHIADFVNWHAKSFYFLDPAGNILELIARCDLRDDIQQSFSSAHIRNISEIGIVFPVDRFQTEVDKLMQQFPVLYFNKQPPLRHFKAIGDDEGLFIVVPENRIWFSTKNKESKIFPVDVQFIHNNKTYQLNAGHFISIKN